MSAEMDNKPPHFRWLTEGELNTFREDYRELEKEIQSFFRAYYISGLILVAAWLTGPQSKPLLELALGNGGYNIYAPMGIALLNAVSIISLIYKSISIHEVTQFAVYFSKSDSAASYWEAWRRSPYNYARFSRPFYSPLLFIVPMGLSCLILIPTGRILYGKPQELIERIKNYQVPPTSIDSTLTTQFIEPERKIVADSKLEEERKAYAEGIGRIFPWAKVLFWIIVVLHLIPLWLAYFNARVVPKRWKLLEESRGWNLLFNDLDSASPEAKTETLSENKADVPNSKDEEKPPGKVNEGKSNRTKGPGKNK
jgi:hypothetical protein